MHFKDLQHAYKRRKRDLESRFFGFCRTIENTFNQAGVDVIVRHNTDGFLVMTESHEKSSLVSVFCMLDYLNDDDSMRVAQFNTAVTTAAADAAKELKRQRQLHGYKATA